MHKISISILSQWYRPDTDLDHIYGMLREAGIDGIDFSLEAIIKEIEGIPDIIRAGDLEVYYNDNEANQADSDDHGILIENGKIAAVY